MVDLTKKRNCSNQKEWKNSIFFSAPDPHEDGPLSMKTAAQAQIAPAGGRFDAFHEFAPISVFSRVRSLSQMYFL